MTRINTEAEWLTQDQKEARKIDRAKNIEGDNFRMGFSKVPFFIKKSEWNPYGSVYSFSAEEDLRQKFFYPHIDSVAVFFDVGAAFGAWTLPALAQGAMVVAFEPDPRQTSVLKENIDFNDFTKFLVMENAVLEKQYDSVSFDELEDVPVTSIDKFVEGYGLVPTFIKIDVEGAEAKVILGAAKTLINHHPKVFVECHIGSVPGIDIWMRQTMQTLGYTHESGTWYQNMCHDFFF